MEILISFLVMALWLGMVLLSRFITTTIHELGHAIPALLFTDKNVIMHIGSYGDAQNSFLISIGRLKAYFKFNFVQLDMGLCMHQNIASVPKAILITLGGPFNSLLFAILLIGIIMTNNFSDGEITLIALFILSALWDFLINLIPTQQPTMLEGGRICYNDGQQFLALVKEMQYPVTYFEGMKYHYEKKYQLATASFETALQEGKKYRGIYDALAQSHLALKDYESALEIYEKLHDKFRLNPANYASVGHIYNEKKEYQEAIEAYSHALHKDYKNCHWLCRRACVYQELSEHLLAIQDFDAAIYYSPSFVETYNNRALSKIRLGDLDGAWIDLAQAKHLNPENPYVYLHFGFYYKERNKTSEALENFQKAKDMKIEHYGIDYYIHELSLS